jgi:hypothetical protein
VLNRLRNATQKSISTRFRRPFGRHPLVGTSPRTWQCSGQAGLVDNGSRTTTAFRRKRHHLSATVALRAERAACTRACIYWVDRHSDERATGERAQSRIAGGSHVRVCRDNDSGRELAQIGLYIRTADTAIDRVTRLAERKRQRSAGHATTISIKCR